MKRLAETVFVNNKDKITQDSMMQLLDQVPHWQLAIIDNVHQLERQFSFADFADALIFTNRVAELAESVNHHPTLITEWGQVTVRWWTHSIKDVHLNDFICAAKTDLIFAAKATNNQ